VSEHTTAADIVRRSERRLQAIIDAEPACVKLVSAEGVLLDMNRAGLDMLGVESLAQIAGRKVFDIVHPADRQRYLSMHQAASNGARVNFEFRIIGLHGRELWMEAHSVPFDAAPFEADPDRVAPSAVLSVTNDVTQRKKLEEQLRQSQRLEAVGRLAGGVAHDFNNLLTAVIGNCDLATMALPGNHPAQDNLTEVRDAAERAAALIQQLLAFSRKQVLSPRVLDINQAVDVLVKILPRVIGEDITTSLQLDPALLHARVDATQLDQVLLNLALNARDAMPTGGMLMIATSNVDLAFPPIAQPCRFEPGAYVKVTFTDTGTGMDVETRTRVFEPFFTTKDTGTGLGLATVYGIVKQSRGFITVDSEPESGTTFTIYLPATTDAVEKVDQPEPDNTSAVGTERVLLVEDAAAVRAFAERTLAASGYTVLPADNGAEALRIAGLEPFDLLLTDIVMPGMNGVELASQLVAAKPSLRVLFMSGYDEDSRARRGANGHPSPMLRKPFTAGALAHAVRQVLDAERPM
jgi:two-component system cell cycle sensor histidine kinase/response regulator CckA